MNNNFRKSGVLPDNLVAMVTPNNLGNQKITFLTFHRLILKVTKFQLPPPERLSTVVKNIFGAIMLPCPPMSYRVKGFQAFPVVRSKNCGGGLLVAIKHGLCSAVMIESGENAEFITIKAALRPQEGSSIQDIDDLFIQMAKSSKCSRIF